MNKLLLPLRFAPLALALCVAPQLAASAQQTVSLPFVCGFDSQEEFDNFTVIDNGDGFKWQYDAGKQNANSQGAFGDVDDWLITPAFHLVPGKEYIVNFDVSSDYYGSTYGQEVEVWLGTGSAKENFTTQLGEKMYIEGKDPQAKELKFTVETEGDYRVAFRVVKTGVFHGTVLDNVQVKEGVSLSSPGQVRELTAAADINGGLSALITFKAPDVTTDGQPLTSLSRIDVIRDGNVVKSFENPAPGQSLSFTDDKDVKEGTNTWQVIGYSGENAGDVESVSAYVGLDVPSAPVKVTAVDMLNGKARVEWQPASKGANGGYVNPTDFTYKVYNMTQNGANLVGSIKGTYAEVALNLAEGQTVVYFLVSAVNEKGESATTWANEYLAGQPYKLPYEESFPKTQPESGQWILHDGTAGGTWRALSVEVYDADGGAMVFTPDEVAETAVLESGMITVAGTDMPRLVFHYKAYPGKKAALRVKVRPEGQLDTELLKSIDYRDLKGEERWEMEQIDLSVYKNKKYITLWFEAEVEDPATAVVIDDLFVRDVKGKDMRITLAAVPEEVVAGRKATVSAKLENRGFAEAKEYGVALYVNGEKVSDVPGEVLDAYAETTVALPFTADLSNDLISVRAEVNMEGDGNPDDNATATMYVSVEAADVPVVTDLRADVEDHAVTLGWSAPGDALKEQTDDAEDYASFTIDDMGPWTPVDVDKMNTDVFPAGRFPNAGTPFAFIVFNPEEAGIDITNEMTAMYAPHSGKQYFAAVCGEGDNDNWLVSERLSGKAQTISFYARSLSTNYGTEKFEVRYSTTDSEPASFTNVAATEEAPAEWKEYNVSLPAEARYFAIRHISGYVWMFMVDDITYTPANDFMGFNVYRDGKKVATVQQPAYSENLDEDGDYEYKVSGVYTQGESKLSDAAKIAVAGIDRVVAAAEHVEVFTLKGILVYSGEYGSLSQAGLDAGVYVVVIDGKPHKMLIM